MTTATAVVSPVPGRVEMATIQVPDPTGSQVLVDVAACGLCHSDLHFIDGTSGTDHPYLLGHEVSGVVRATGPAVSDFGAGDEVIGCLIVPCADCEDCRRGRPKSCRRRRPALPRPRLEGGGELTPVLGVGGLAEIVLLDEQHLARLPAGLDIELGALLGCGATTGFGAAVNTGGVRPGDRVAVIGAGGVGLAAIAGARASGAAVVLAVDRDEQRFDLAREFGATATATPVALPDVAAPTRAFDVVIDCVGGEGPFLAALGLVETGGRIVIAGAPRRDEQATFPMRPLFDRRAEVVVSHLGDCQPAVDLPRMAALVATGQFPLGLYRSETVGLAEAPAAYERLRSGEVLRSIIDPRRDRQEPS